MEKSLSRVTNVVSHSVPGRRTGRTTSSKTTIESDSQRSSDGVFYRNLSETGDLGNEVLTEEVLNLHCGM